MTGVAGERELLVRQLTWEADGVLGVVLVDPAGAALPGWEPGAHIDLLLDGVTPSGGAPAAGPAEPMVRHYSLCGDPAEVGSYRIGVLREPAGRGGSAYVHSTLRPGDRVQVRGPRNHFRLEPSTRYLFIAGGIGITPILPMIAAARVAGADWRLLYGGRSAASMAYTSAFAADDGRVALRPQDVHGLLDLEAELAEPRSGTLVYCCGPEPLISAVEKHCAGWPEGALHVERFAAPAQPVRDPADEHSVEVVLARSGRSVLVPAERPILDVLLESGVDVLSDCREGICGTCEVDVLDGEVDHRDFVLTESERAANTCLMVCVSRSRSPRLTLDL
jgi:ferredoxin-NADP reductase